MPFCPNCKNEYEVGITHCADCGAELVDTISYIDMTLVYTYKSKRVLDRFLEYLDYSKIKTVVNENAETGEYELYASPRDVERVKRAYAVLISVELGRKTADNLSPSEAQNLLNNASAITEESVSAPGEELLENLDESADGDAEDENNDVSEDEGDSFMQELYQEESVSSMTTANIRTRGNNTYTSAEFRAKDTLSTGIMLLIFGIVGLGLVLLSYLGIWVVLHTLFSQIVMGAVFIVLLILGVYSISHYSRCMDEATVENEQIETIKNWIALNLTKETIETQVPATESEEETFLLYQKYIEEQLDAAFPDADPLLLEHMAEELYTNLYEV